MASSQNTQDVEGIPTVKPFADLPRPRYHFDRDYEDLFDDPDGFEHFDNYEPGGFCPIDLSFPSNPNFINDRFEVIYKLGYGGYGMVWLCYEGAVKKWRAVKVGKASQSEEHSGEVLVESIMKKQHSIGVAEAMDNNIVLPLETFWIDSINGKHLCTVLPLLGPRLSDWVQWLEEEEDDPEQAQRIVSQMVKGMDFLHSHGICHGDFRPGNILMQLKGGIDDIGIDEMCDILEEPAMVDILLRNRSKSPYSPKQAVSSVIWKRLSEFVSDKIAVVDFGQSYLTTNPNPRDLGIPGYYAAPEIVLGGAKGIATDIWALGRTILEFRPRLRLISTRHTLSKVREMEEFCGPCPPPFRQAAQQRLFGDQGKSSKGDKEEKKRTESRTSLIEEPLSTQTMSYIAYRREEGRKLRKYDHPIDDFLGLDWAEFQLSRDEVLSLGNLLQNMMRWKPEQRWDTKKVLAHRWFSEKYKPGEPSKENEALEKKDETDFSADQGHAATHSSTKSTAKGTITDVSDDHIDMQQVVSRQKAAWFYLQVLTLAFYLLGVAALIVYFYAHMLVSHLDLYADRRMVTSRDLVGMPSTVVQYVIVVLIIQA